MNFNGRFWHKAGHMGMTRSKLLKQIGYPILYYLDDVGDNVTLGISQISEGDATYTIGYNTVDSTGGGYEIENFYPLTLSAEEGTTLLTTGTVTQTITDIAVLILNSRYVTKYIMFTNDIQPALIQTGSNKWWCILNDTSLTHKVYYVDLKLNDHSLVWTITEL